MDAALQHRPGGGAGRRLRGDGEGRRAGDPRGKLAGALCAGAGRLPPCRRGEGQPNSSGAPISRCSPSSPARRPRAASASSPATSSRWARAPASSTSRRPSARTTSMSARRKACRWSIRWIWTATSPARRRPMPGLNVFEANKADHPRPQGGRRRLPPRDLRPQLSALLAHRPAADLQGDAVLVRRGDQVPRPHGGAQPGHHLGAARMCATASSATGWPTRATGTSAATASGARRSRCGSRTIRTIRAPTSMARWTSWSAISACGRRTCTGPMSTS